jgi:hypothetical protein
MTATMPSVAKSVTKLIKSAASQPVVAPSDARKARFEERSRRVAEMRHED